MIKLTLTGSNPTAITVNPLHLVECIRRPNGSTSIRLMNGNAYEVIEGTDVIQDQMVAWQHRTHQ